METTKRNIPSIIRNDERLYEGNLVYYFRLLFSEAENLTRPYHNLRHMLHVTWLCYKACLFYKDTLTARQMRTLLIGALLHDINHSGTKGDDSLNIARSIEWLEMHVAEEDRRNLSEIMLVIRATEYPHTAPNEEVGLLGGIIRDADASQVLSPVWIQQVVFGLAGEWEEKPVELLKRQESYLRSLHFITDWAREEFPQEVIDDRIEESTGLLELLETGF